MRKFVYNLFSLGRRRSIDRCPSNHRCPPLSVLRQHMHARAPPVLLPPHAEFSHHHKHRCLTHRLAHRPPHQLVQCVDADATYTCHVGTCHLDHPCQHSPRRTPPTSKLPASTDAT